jgi:hypothetical protein
MADARLSYFKIDVEFNPNAITNQEIPMFTFTMDGEPLPDNTLTVPHGIGMIVFNLHTPINPEQDEQALFQTYPVQWLDPENLSRPILTPHMFHVQRIGDQTFTLLDFNSAQSPTTHQFNLVVLYRGKTYGSDPTIVNEPPIQ